MKKLILSAVLAVSGLASAATWDIDSAHATANFTAKHLGITNVNGTLGSVSGKFNVDDKDITKSTLEATIDVKGINTGTAKRDDHLKSPDFFDVAKFPEAKFKSTKVEKGSADNKLKVTGDLTMHGVTKPVTLKAEVSSTEEDPWGNTRVGLEITGALSRGDYDMKFNQALGSGNVLVSDKVKLALDVSAVKA